jgi:membrane-associated phospholipid phosphatase
MFTSYFSIVMYSTLVCIGTIWLATRTFPFIVAGRVVWDTIRKPWIILHFAMMFFILFLNKNEMKWETAYPRDYDISPFFYSIEGDTVKWIQTTFENGILTNILTFFYVVVMTSLLVSVFIIYHHKRDLLAFKAMFYAIAINYLLAIPFYMFFPVDEVWFSGHGVRFLIPEVYPDFESQYRNLSGINNCFPSLHTSLSLTLFFVSLRSSSKWAKWFTGISAACIIFGIFYLGIHWIIDSFGGAVLAFVAATVGYKIAKWTKWSW